MTLSKARGEITDKQNLVGPPTRHKETRQRGEKASAMIPGIPLSILLFVRRFSKLAELVFFSFFFLADGFKFVWE